MRLSARNQLPGTVVAIEKGAVNGIVRIELKGGEVVRDQARGVYGSDR